MTILIEENNENNIFSKGKKDYLWWFKTKALELHKKLNGFVHQLLIKVYFDLN